MDANVANNRFLICESNGTVLLSSPLPGAADATNLSRIESIQARPTDGVTLRCLVLPGHDQRIQASDDLAHWTTVSTITNAPHALTFTDLLPMSPHRFYRISDR